MIKPVTPQDLLIKYRGEHPHAQHVAKLCAVLFDAVQPEIHFTPSERKILLAAALLHDVGYSRSPSDHVEASVRIVTRFPLCGFSQAQHNMMAAIIALHRKNFIPALKSPAVTQLRKPERAMKLAAILCIADGLDHSHVQDCEIQRVNMTPGGLVIRVNSSWYAGNLGWADAKTGLWRHVFGSNVHIIEEHRRQEQPSRFHQLVKKDAGILEAFRVLMYAQYRSYVDNIDGACGGENSEYLHDIRVALRRARMLFVYFEPAFTGLSSTDTHRAFINQLTNDLSRARDFQVWMDYLHSVEPSIPQRNRPQWDLFLSRETTKNEHLVSSIEKILLATSTVRGNRALAYFLRVTLPDLIFRQPAPTAYSTYSATRLKKRMKRLKKLPAISSSTPPEKTHEVRKMIRKIRYFSEYADPVLPPVISELTRLLKKVADALGSVHDLDVHAVRLRRLKKNPPPPALLRIITAERNCYWSSYQSAWARLTAIPFQKKVMSALRRAQHKAP